MTTVEQELVLPPALLDLPADDLLELACKESLGVWQERKRGFENAPLHWEWCDLVSTATRLCVVAPREHAKSEVFTVSQSAWRVTYQPGVWCYVFASTGDQAGKLLERIVAAVEETCPELVDRALKQNSNDVIFANRARVTTAGAGKGVRGAHPDVIMGDDVLEEGNCMTQHQRRGVERWWLGTVAGMAHPGTYRSIGGSNKVFMPPTKVFLVGTPFHQQDLLMSMRENPMYQFRRYAAEYEPEDLVDGFAVEVA